jgi:HlyD family secretion protein
MGEKTRKIITVIKKRRAPIALFLVVAAVAAFAIFYFGQGAKASDYITGRVERGNVEVAVSATGTVQAVTTVQVGSQVSGTVQWLGADFNSNVRRGEVVARLDPALFQAELDNAQANIVRNEAAVRDAQTQIETAKANLEASKANLEVTRVLRDDAIALVRRYEELSRAKVIAGRDLEKAQADASSAAARYTQAAADIGRVQASIKSAEAALAQARANLQSAIAQRQRSAVNLQHSVITSPIDGVVVSRNVDVGQTVAASLQAPTLFTIANDLTKMQVLASIDEADVGQIKQGIKANFTVDAFPGETFTGDITQLRLNAQTLQNVVTYSAVIEVSNPELKLRPGMTTNITIPVARRENVLTVPNAALRFRPNISEQEIREKMEARSAQRQSEREAQGEQSAPQQEQPRQGRQRGEGQGGQQAGQQGSGQQGAGQQGGEQGQRRQGSVVWVLAGQNNVEPRFVRTGLTNGRVTEILGGDLQENDVVIIGQNEQGGNRQQQQQNPFQPRGPGGPGGRGPR